MAEGDLRGSSTRFSLSFSGSGFLVLYQVGVVQSLLELAPELLKSACKVYGSSAGSLIAAAVVCGVSLDDLKEFFFAMAKEVRKTILGPLSPKCSLLANIKTVLQQMLPEDSYQLASGRLHISLTRVVDGQNVMASEFSSKEELIQALLCSCFLPIYCGFIPPSYRGVRYVDGGFTGLQPVSSLEEAVITVSPFTGELDICPRDCPAIFLCFQIFNGSIQISIENLCRISYALFPPSAMVLNDIFSQGYQDTALFLYRNNAFGFNYFDGNFRFASMCGKNDSAQSNRTCTGLCKRVPQCLIPCFLPGLALWRKEQVTGLQDPLSKVLLQPYRLPAFVRKGLQKLWGLLEGMSSMVKRFQKLLQTTVPGLPKTAVARRQTAPLLQQPFYQAPDLPSKHHHLQAGYNNFSQPQAVTLSLFKCKLKSPK
ncbi:omega-hydroxyceramide transacylase isoform X1 [Aquila chrysaetos chrysaetos]|uniref:omega-hydroxyceramide transacylase isoform X1 n=2 Tax=Aquila chrysaetos chrysaetos TaxID=223781 RepID=UPI001176C2C4|nr:omega-hydroxyceramide transacylase isoform X1 [Aquila chrysaetos chrysaetos]